MIWVLVACWLACSVKLAMNTDHMMTDGRPVQFWLGVLGGPITYGYGVVRGYPWGV